MRSSKARAVVLGLLLLAVAFAAQKVYAQGAGAAAGTEPVVEMVPSNIYFLVLQNLEVVAITIILCSVVAVALIIQGFLRVRRPVLLPQQSVERMRQMISQRQFRQLLEYTESDPGFVARALNPSLKRAPHFAGMKEAMETAVAEQTAEQFRRLEFLNILANVGPLLGLLGTVIGIMQAFLEMQRHSGQATPAHLAGGIAVALGTTMLGLMLAIPCLVAYGVLRTKADRLTTEGALQAEELLLMIKPGDAEPSSAAAHPAPPPHPVRTDAAPSSAPLPAQG